MLKKIILDGTEFELQLANITFTNDESISFLNIQIGEEETIANVKSFVDFANQSDSLTVALNTTPAVTLNLTNPNVKFSINERDSEVTDAESRPTSINLEVKGETFNFE